MGCLLLRGSSGGFVFNNANWTNTNANTGNASHLCQTNKSKGLAAWQKITTLKGAGRDYRMLRIDKQSMKRINNLFDKICNLENLYLAHQKARRGKGSRYGVILFEKNFDRNILQIYQELTAGTYRTSVYQTLTIYDPKEREISRLPFRDRIVHHAIMNILEKEWVKIFIAQTYSCIKGRGIHKALQDVRKGLHDAEKTKYCLKIDIRKFYPSIDHDVLKGIIRRKIKDLRLLSLLDEIIDSAPGIPIGNYMSQFFANLYLSYFDHWMKEEMKVKYYYRYADDMVILADNKPYLHAILSNMKKYMSGILKLQLKGNYQVFPVEKRGIDFVGYVFYHTHILMRKSIKVRFCKRTARLNKKHLTLKEYRMCIAPWLGWAKHCNSKNLLKTIIKDEDVFRIGS